VPRGRVKKKLLLDSKGVLWKLRGKLLS